jgi:hypothetical protein
MTDYRIGVLVKSARNRFYRISDILQQNYKFSDTQAISGNMFIHINNFVTYLHFISAIASSPATMQ